MSDNFFHPDYGFVELPFPTGTRVYGPAREDSDYDYVFSSHDYGIITAVLDLLGLEYKEVNPQDYECPSISIALPNGKTLNFIWASPERELPAWFNATKEMSKLDPIEDREDRIAHFHELLAF